MRGIIPWFICLVVCGCGKTQVLLQDSTGAPEILGVQSGLDETIDNYLSFPGEVSVHWTPYALADSYDVSIFVEGADMPLCVARGVSDTETVLPCAVEEFVRYRLVLVANRFDDLAVPAANNDFHFFVDYSPPAPVDLIQLFSLTSLSLNATPQFRVVHSGGDGEGSGVSHYEVQTQQVGMSGTTDWRRLEVGETLQVSDLQLTQGKQYEIVLRAIDRAGLASEEVVSESWLAESPRLLYTVEPDRYTGVITLSGGELDTLSYGPMDPLAAQVLRISDTVAWPDEHAPCFFIAAGTLSFGSAAVIDASGRPALQQKEGADGASGGGAPSHGIGGDGGSAGGDGTTAGGQSPGQGRISHCVLPSGLGIGGRGGAGGDTVHNTGELVRGGMGGLSGIGAGGGGGAGGGNGKVRIGSSGGGGGGTIVIIADRIEGAALLSVNGGAGNGEGISGGGGGGGGVVWVAAKHYSGQLVVNVAGGRGGGEGLGPGNPGEAGRDGDAHIFQILPDGSLRERKFVDTW